MDARVRARRILEMDLRQAIIDGSFEVYYQPSVTLEDNKIVGCEALLRWRHSERGMISPAEFIPVAEDLAGSHQARGQRLADPIQERHAGVEDRCSIGGFRPAGEPVGTGDYRGGAYSR